MASSLSQQHPQTEIGFESPPPIASSIASTSASANPSNNHEYDVFLNHRGPDTKKNFASLLYRRLLLHGFQAFLDKEELQQGENFDSEIKAAIKSASVHVAIFSPTYGESPWCLKELFLMVETGATIIPVFYNVKPSDLRCTKGRNGLYAQALHDHEQKLRYDSQTLENWRNALSRVADISGFELEAYNGDEGELLEKVVERVLKRVERLGFEVAEFPTGLDKKVNDFENRFLLQQVQRGKPRIFGIVGLGGVGKTTLAKELFNRKNSYYRSSCFLFNVRDNATIELQNQLLKSLTRLHEAINSIDEGKVVLKKHLSSRQAFVILDDVDHVNQLDAFSPIKTVLSSDSLILITSRDKAVLKSWVEETSIYKLNGLDVQHSRELFCSHAFRRPDPLRGFESLVEKFIKACDGLPLSLKVFGALLYGTNDQSEWVNHLDSLQEILPSDIQGRLKISYDRLDEQEKKIFLDIACFFIGEDIDKALRLWDGSGCQRFKNLQNKCLVELDSKNNIHMHDHLRDMGRAIAKDSKLKLPGRICCSTQNIDDLLGQSYAAVRGIMVVPTARRPDYRDISDDHFFDCNNNEDWDSKLSWFKMKVHDLPWDSKMSWFKRKVNHGFLGVDLLDVEDGDMERILGMVRSPNVKWVRWYKCPYSSLPSWIPMKNLTFLEVSGSALETLWQGPSQAPLQLKELHIYAALSKIPKSIGQLKHLERVVIFSRELCLDNLPEDFYQLRSLKFLVLRNCLKLKSLPDSFGDLINLEYLDLSYSWELEMLPNSFGNLIRLKYLCLRGCANLIISAQTLGNIRALQHLDLSLCERMEISAQTLGRALEDLDLSLIELSLVATNLKELPSAMRNLSDLKVLEIGSRKLHSLPPWLGELKNLTTLFIIRCPLRELPFKKVEGQRETSADSSFREFLPRLQYLIITQAEISEISFGEVSFPNLHLLIIRACHKLKKIEGLCHLAKLQELRIYGCEELEELPNVEHYRSLNIVIESCSKLQLKY